MAISENQLETWSHQGAVAQSKSTYDIVKTALQSSDAPYFAQSYTISLQGSYGNDTNILSDSDVDVVMRLDSTFYSDISELPDAEKYAFNQAISTASYQLSNFKQDVEGQLRTRFGASVRVGKKAVFVCGSGNRRDADVLPCAEFRRYRKFSGWSDQHYVEGICFFLADGTRIENFPKQHSENCTAKHQATNQWFKPTVRTLKNLRNRLIEQHYIAEGLAPSYFLEGLLYNVPVARFGGNHTTNFTDVIDWLLSADRTNFVCANEQFYLLRENSSVTWRVTSCQQFLDAVVQYWNAN